MINQLTDVRPWLLSRRVLPQHTDHAGVMWHGSYLSWLEEARIDALAQVGLSYKCLSENGFEMPVVSLQIDYINAIQHGDHVLLESLSLPRRGIRWPWKTRFFRSGDIVAKASIDLVLVKKFGSNYRLVREIPKEILECFVKLHRGPSPNT